jgi:hypothetical protein
MIGPYLHEISARGRHVKWRGGIPTGFGPTNRAHVEQGISSPCQGLPTRIAASNPWRERSQGLFPILLGRFQDQEFATILCYTRYGLYLRLSYPPGRVRPTHRRAPDHTNLVFLLGPLSRVEAVPPKRDRNQASSSIVYRRLAGIRDTQNRPVWGWGCIEFCGLCWHDNPLYY